MTYVQTTEWSLVLQGADRGELSAAFRESRWRDSWYDRMSPLEDDNPDSRMVVTLPIPDIDTLIEALACVGGLQPVHGIILCGYADFGSLRANYSLCTRSSGFGESSCSLHRAAAGVSSDMSRVIERAETALAELKMLVAESQCR